MPSDQRIIKLHERLPEVQSRLHEMTREIIKLSGKQAKLAKFCRFIGRMTEIHEGVPLEIGSHFARALNKEYTRYAYYRTHPDDVELRPKNMRWIVDFIDHPPANPDGTTNRQVALTLKHIKSQKIVITLAKEWIVHGVKPMSDYEEHNE